MSFSNTKPTTERLRQPRHAGPMKLAMALLSLLVFGWLLVTPGTVQGQTNTATTITPTIRIELPWLDADGDNRNDFMGQTIRVSFTSSPVILRLLNNQGQEITEAEAARDGAQAITLKGCTNRAWGEVTVQTETNGVRTVAIGNIGPQLINVPAGQTESCNYEVGFPRLPGVSLYPGSTIYFSADTEEVPGKGATVYGSYSVPPSPNSRPSSTSPNRVDPLATTNSFFTPSVNITVADNDDDSNTAHERSGTTVTVTFRSNAIATNPVSGCSNNETGRLTVQDDGTATLAAADAPQLVNVPTGYGGGCRYAVSFSGIAGYSIAGGGITSVEADHSSTTRDERIAEVRYHKVRPSSGALQTTYFTPRIEITVPNGFAGTTFDVVFTPYSTNPWTGSSFECNTPEFIAAHRAAQATNPRAPRPQGSSSFTATYTVPSTGNRATGRGPNLVNQPAAYVGGGEQLEADDQLELVPPCRYTITWPEVAGLELSTINGRASEDFKGSADYGLTDSQLAEQSATETAIDGVPEEQRAQVTASADRVTAEYVAAPTTTTVTNRGTSRTAELPILTQTYFTPSIDIDLPSLASDNEDLNPENDYTDFTLWVNIWPAAGTTTDLSARSICGEAGVAPFAESDVGNSFAEGAENTGRIMRVELTVNSSGTLVGDIPRLVDSPGAYYLTAGNSDEREFVALPRCEYVYTVAELYNNELVLRMFDGSPWDIGESTLNTVTEATGRVLNEARALEGLDPIDEFVDTIYPIGSLSATDSTISATYEVYATSIAFPTESDIARSYFTPDIQIEVPQVDYNNDGVKDYAGTTFEIKFAPDQGSSFMCNTFEVVSAWLIEAEAWATENDNTGNTDDAPRQPANTRATPNAVPAHSAIYTVQDDGTVTGEAPRLPNQPNTYVGPDQLAPKCEYDVIWPLNEGELDEILASVAAENPNNVGIVSATSPGEIVVPNPCVSELTLDVETIFTYKVGAGVNRVSIFFNTKTQSGPDEVGDDNRVGDGGQVQGKFLQDRPVDICNFDSILREILVREGVIGEAVPTYFTPTIDIKLGPSVASRYAGETFTVRFIPEPGSAIDCGRELEVEIAAAEATATSENLVGADYNARVIELLDEHFNEEDRPIVYYYHEAEYTVQPDGSVTGTAPRLVNQADAYDKDRPNPSYDSSQPLSRLNSRYLRVVPCVYDVIWPLVELSGNNYLRPALEPSRPDHEDPLPTEAEFDSEESLYGFRSIGFTNFNQLFHATTKVDGVEDDDTNPSTARAIYFESADDPIPDSDVPARVIPPPTRFTPNVMITVPQDDLDGNGVNDYAGTTFTVEFYPVRGSVFDCNNAEHSAVAGYLAARNSATFDNQNTPRPIGYWPYTATYTVRDDGSVAPADQASVNNLLVDQVQEAYLGGGSQSDPLEPVDPCSYRVEWPEGSGFLELAQINGQTPEGDSGFASLTKAQIKELNDQLSDARVDRIIATLQSDESTEFQLRDAVDDIIAGLESRPDRVVRIPDFSTDATGDYLTFATKAEAIRALTNNTVPYATVSAAQTDASASYNFGRTTFTPRVNIIVPQDDTDGTPGNDYAGATFEVEFWPVPGERQHVACWPSGYDWDARRWDFNTGNRIAGAPYSATYTVQPDGSVTGEGPTLVDEAIYHIIPTDTPIPGVTFAETQTRKVKCVYSLWWPLDTGSQLSGKQLELLDEASRAPIRWLDADTTASAIYFLTPTGGADPVIPAFVPPEDALVNSYFTPNLVIELPGTATDYVGTTFDVKFVTLPDLAAECGGTHTATYTVQSDGMVTGTAPRLLGQPASYEGGNRIANPAFNPRYDPLGLYDADTLGALGVGEENPYASTYSENPRYLLDPDADPPRLADPCSYRVEMQTAVTASGTAAGVTLQVDTINGARAPEDGDGIDAVIRSWDKAQLMTESGLSEAVVEALLAGGGLTDLEISAIIEGLFTGMTDDDATTLIDGGLTQTERDTRMAAIISADATVGFSAEKIRRLATNTVPAAMVNADQTDATFAYVVEPEALVATYFTPRVDIIVPQRDNDDDDINDFSGTDIVLEFRPRQPQPPTVLSYSYWCNNPDGLPEIIPGDDRPIDDAVPPYTATYRVQDDGTVALRMGTEAAGDPPSLRLIDEPAAYAPDGTRALACTYSVTWPENIGSGNTALVNIEHARECSTLSQRMKILLNAVSCTAGETFLVAFYSTYLDSETTLAGIYFEAGGDIPEYVWQPGDEVDCDPTRPGLMRLGNNCENEMPDNTPATVVKTYFSPTVNFEVPMVDTDGDGDNDYSEATATSFTVEFFPVLGSARDCLPEGYDSFSYDRTDPSTAPYHATYTVQTDGSVTADDSARLVNLLVNQPAATVTDQYAPASKCAYDLRQTITTSPRNLMLQSVNGQSTIDPDGYDPAQNAPEDGLTAAQILALSPNTLAPATVSESQQTATYVYVADGRLPRSTFRPEVNIEVPQMDGEDMHNIYSGTSFTVEFWPTGWTANTGCFPDGYNYSPTRKNAPAPYTATYTVDDDGNVMSSNVPDLVHQPGDAYTKPVAGVGIPATCNYQLAISVGDSAGLQLDAVDGSQIGGSTGLERMSADDIKRLRPDLSDSAIAGFLAGGLTDDEIREIVSPAAARIPIEFDFESRCVNNCLTGLMRRIASESAIRGAALNTISPAIVSNREAGARFTYVARPPRLTATYFTPIINIGVPQNDGENDFAGYRFEVRFRPAPGASFHCNPHADVRQHLSEITDQLQATEDNLGALRPLQRAVNTDPAEPVPLSDPDDSWPTPGVISTHSVTYTVQPDGSVTSNNPSFRLMDQPPAWEQMDNPDFDPSMPVSASNARKLDVMIPAAGCVYSVEWPNGPHDHDSERLTSIWNDRGTSGEEDLVILNRDGASFVIYLSAESSVVSAIYHKSGELPPGYIPTLEELDLVQTYFTPKVVIEVPQVNDGDGHNIYAGTTFTVEFWPKRATASSGGVISETGAAFECNPYDFYVDKRSEIRAMYEQAYSDLGSEATDEAIRAAVEAAMDAAYAEARAAVARGDEPATSLFNIGYYSAIYTVQDDGMVTSDNPPRLIDQPAAYQGGGDGTNPEGHTDSEGNPIAGDSQLAPPCEYEASISDNLDNLRLISINGMSTQPDLDAQIKALSDAELMGYTDFDNAKITELRGGGGLDADDLTEIKLALEIAEVLKISNLNRQVPYARVSAATAVGEPPTNPPTFVYDDYDEGFVPQIDFRIPSWDADRADGNDFAGTVLWVDFVPTDISPAECPTRERRAYTVGDDGGVTAGYEKEIGGETVMADAITSLPGYVTGSSTPCSYEITIYESGWPFTEYSISPLYLESLSQHIISASNNGAIATFKAPFSPLGTVFRPQANILVPVVDSSGSNEFAGARLTITYTRSADTLGDCTETAMETYTVSSLLSQTTAEIGGTSANLVMSTDSASYADIIASLTDDDDTNNKTICEYEITTSVSGADLAVRPTSDYYLDEPAEVPMFADYRSVSIAETTTYQIDTGQATGKVFACDAETAGSPELPRPQASVSCGIDFPEAFTGDYFTHNGQDPSGAATSDEINIGTDALVLIHRPNVYLDLSLVRLKTITLSLTTPDGSRSGERARVTITGTLKTPSENLSPRLIGGEDSGFPRNYQPCYFSHDRTMMIGSDGSAADVMVMAVDIDGGEDSGCEYVVSWPEISGLATPADTPLGASDTTATETYTAS